MLDNIEKDIKRLKKSICCLNSAIADCCYTEVTLAEMQSLVASNSLKTGSFYGISDANANLYGGTLVILQAVTSNKLSEAGHGVFYNPIYDRASEWLGMWHEIGFFTGSNLTLEFEMFEPITADNGATGQLIANGGNYKTYFKPLTGNWAAATSITGDNSGATLDIASVYVPSYSVDDKLIWGGVLWNNLTGSIGSKVDEFELDNVNWEKIAYNTTDYDMVVDQIVYDYDHDQITARIDSFGNRVVSSYDQNDLIHNDSGIKNPIAVFKWGYGYNFDTDQTGFMSNTITDSVFETLNWYKTIAYGNYILSYSAVVDNPYVINFRFIGNYIHNESFIDNNYFVNSVDFIANVIINNCQVSSNVLSQASNITNNRLYNASVQSNYLLDDSEIVDNILDARSEINSNTLTKDCSIKNSMLADSRIVQNTLNDSCRFETNNLTLNTEISQNVLSNGSTMLYNELASNSYIIDNILSDNSNIINNQLKSDTYIEANQLTEFSEISNNFLSNSSGIDNNTVNENSLIEENTLNSDSHISGSTMHTGAEIKRNTLEGSDLYSNFLNNSYIRRNMLTGGSAMDTNTLTDESEIRANNLNGDSYINSNVLGTGDGIRSNNLTNSTFTFSNISGIITGVHAVSAGSVGDDIGSATIIYASYSKNMITDSSSALKLTYIDGSGTLQVVDVTT